ncbi:MAG TPA: hypothetical protein PLK30_27030 [Blastocatellia bacterium]|nr:hypothetical protein [Blastocatellia bacterium]
MKRTNWLKTVVCMALLFSIGSFPPPAIAQDLRWIDISFSLQTVQVHTSRGDYPAVFKHETVIQPNGAARGALWLATPRGTLVRYDSFYGQGVYKPSDSGVTWQQITLYLRAPDGRWLIALLRPAAQEECVVYDLVGPGVHASWEAQGQVTLSQR